jgi:hypothetical protein
MIFVVFLARLDVIIPNEQESVKGNATIAELADALLTI